MNDTLVETVDQPAIEEMREFVRELARREASQPPLLTSHPTEIRKSRHEGNAAFPPPARVPEAMTQTIRGRGGDIPLRVFQPTGSVTGVYLHLHGGGWAWGGADLQDVRLLRMARVTGLVVASVEYRLAPEHPFPAGLEDCEDAALWLIAGGAAELGAPARLAIGGESAGAHLSVLTLLRLRDRHRAAEAFGAANLLFGCYDLSGTPSVRLASPARDRFMGMLLPGSTPEERRSPDVSPLYADLHGLPPAIFTVGTADMVLDDTLFMAARWLAAGCRAELRVWPEAPHGFTSGPEPVAMARAAIDRTFAFLAEALSATG